MALDKERKQEIIRQWQRAADDTGSPEVQIALLTERINRLAEHLRVHKKTNIPDGAYCCCTASAVACCAIWRVST